MIRVLIVDDQDIVREGLRVVLGASPQIEVVGVAADGAAAVEQAAALRPDVTLMDLKMPLMDGVQATQAIRQRTPEVAVIVLTTYDEDTWILDAIRAGAAGYLLKDTSSASLVAAIEGVVAGRTHIDPAVAARLFSFVRTGVPARSAVVDQLSERELGVLRLLASGLSNSAIGDRLGLAEGTVRNHVTSIFAKLGVADRAQATALAWRYGLVTPDGG
ncbi:response regulator transcription factor [Chloroflexia bacterium SDU3-3]|nr:response regulator transcription factor [Chloroflexia bacterium SDU3-3]